MNYFLNSKILRNACKDLINCNFDALDSENMPCVSDLSNDDLLALATHCMRYDNELGFITDGNNHDDILARIACAFNSTDTDDTQDLIDCLQEALIDYYLTAIDDVLRDVADDLYNDQLAACD